MPVQELAEHEQPSAAPSPGTVLEIADAVLTVLAKIHPDLLEDSRREAESRLHRAEVVRVWGPRLTAERRAELNGSLAWLTAMAKATASAKRKKLRRR